MKGRGLIKPSYALNDEVEIWGNESRLSGRMQVIGCAKGMRHRNGKATKTLRYKEEEEHREKTKVTCPIVGAMLYKAFVTAQSSQGRHRN